MRYTCMFHLKELIIFLVMHICTYRAYQKIARKNLISLEL